MIEVSCNCERKVHRAPLDGAWICSGAIEKITEILKDYSRIYVVADENTFPVAGVRVEEILKACGKHHATLVLKGDVLPNAETLGNVLLYASDLAAKANPFGACLMPDFILAVGSGTLNDVSRLTSYRLGLPYGIVATAPSMDGYASAGSPILHDGTKTTIQATTPKFIIGDLDILTQAPWEMMLAGIGDMFGKYVGILDWELARDKTGEFFCEKIASDVLDATNKCLESAENLQSRSAETVKNVMEGFLVTGLGMAYVGNSRPASGSEHIIAHAWEVFAIERGEKPSLHGLEVCEGTRLVAMIYELLAKETKDGNLKALIEKYLPFFRKVEAFCEKMNVPMPVRDRETMLAGIRRALTMRDRYTVLFYLRDEGTLESYATRAVDLLLEKLKD